MSTLIPEVFNDCVIYRQSLTIHASLAYYRSRHMDDMKIQTWAAVKRVCQYGTLRRLSGATRTLQLRCG